MALPPRNVSSTVIAGSSAVNRPPSASAESVETATASDPYRPRPSLGTVERPHPRRLAVTDLFIDLLISLPERAAG
jgi:hypothetical protein